MRRNVRAWPMREPQKAGVTIVSLMITLKKKKNPTKSVAC
jgi:hypothetical protein